MDTRAQAIAQQMKEEGRSQAWLAERTGLSATHVSEVLAGKRPLTDAFHARCMLAFGNEAATATDVYKGRVVTVPASVYRRLVAAEIVSHTYDDAWKAAWVAEHGAEVLAAAAEAALISHNLIAAAEREALATRASA